MDPFAYGIIFDTNKTFTEQFGSMLRSMPQMSLFLGPTMENCDYCNYGMDSKNCYMCTSAMWSENCYYSCLPGRDYYDVDGYANIDGRYNYECRQTINCYKCQYAIYAYDCRSCKFMLDCRDCEFCFGCANINHKKYCIYNVQYDKKTYIEKLTELEKESANTLLQKFVDFTLTLPRRATR